MLDDRPVLKDRLFATAVFSGIAIAAVAAFEMLIGAGFDPITPSFAQGPAPAPTPYVEVTEDVAFIDGGWAPRARTTAVAYNEPVFIVDEWNGAYGEQDLEGGYDDAPPGDAIDDQDLQRDIDRLYADDSAEPQESYSYQPAPLDESVFYEAPACDAAATESCAG